MKVIKELNILNSDEINVLHIVFNNIDCIF